MSTATDSPRRGYSYGPSTKSGKIPFKPPGTDLECETAYWLWGNLEAKQPPLIVVHGGPGAPGRDWQAVASIYEKYDVPLILYDQIGCGASTRLPQTKGDTSFWRLELFHAELDNLRKHFGIEKFNLLGHSHGAMIAVSYVLDCHPTGLHKLVIASTSASEALRALSQQIQRDELPPEIRDPIVTCEKEGRMDAPEYHAAVMEYVQRHLCRIKPWPAEVVETMALLSEDDTTSSTLYGGLPLEPAGPGKNFSVINRLKEITETTIPGGVLLTNGRYDMSQDRGMMPYFTDIRARVKWVRFAESSHMAHLEEPEAYLAALGEFLTLA